MSVQHKDDNKIKHLEFIQLVITRMNINSFLLKGWTVTLMAAVLAFSAKDSDTKYFWIAFAGIIVFWGLDAYYLLQERLFRCLYNDVRQKDEVNIDYNMDTSNCKKIPHNNWINCILSPTILLFYILLIVISLCIIFIY